MKYYFGYENYTELEARMHDFSSKTIGTGFTVPVDVVLMALN